MATGKMIRRVKDDLRLDAENNLIAWAFGVVMTAMIVGGLA